MQAKAQSSAIVMPSKELLLPGKYCESIHQTKRRPTRTIMVRRDCGLLLGAGAAGNGGRHVCAPETLRWLCASKQPRKGGETAGGGMDSAAP